MFYKQGTDTTPEEKGVEPPALEAGLLLLAEAAMPFSHLPVLPPHPARPRLLPSRVKKEKKPKARLS